MKDEDKVNNEDTYLDDEIKSFAEKEEKRRKSPPFILLFLLTTVAVLFALGLSFSTIRFLENNETINSIISSLVDEEEEKKYIITYSENSGNYENGINLRNQFPIPDSEGKLYNSENSYYKFSLILGEKTVGAYYELTAVPNNSQSTRVLDPKYVKLYLEKNGRGVDFSYKENNKVKTLADYTKSKYNETDGVVIYSGTITSEDVKNKKIDFVMRMWVSDDEKIEDLTEISERSFAVKVNTYAAVIR